MNLKPTHKAIKTFHTALGAYTAQDVTHELAVKTAFQTMLADTARARKWLLVPELTMRHRGRHIRPDGVLRDEFAIPRGYWETKDTHDDLDREIQNKIASGYPTTNIIFDDTQHAVLYQDGQEVLRVDLRSSAEIAELLNAFYTHTEPDIEEFERAVDEFKERVPDLALGLAERIGEAHKKNKKFQQAFADFFELCKSSLNPNLSQAAVDEMLVQHLLTERLIRTIFDNSDFVRRNVIAAEIEKVIDALVSQDFNRGAFLKSLDRFYTAIEDAARDIEDFSDKQHFLNSVYERFFQGYSVKVADTHGIVYTPQAIVDFMCASVEHVLKEEFGLDLTSPEVLILDPCTGTGNFIVNLLNRMDKRHLPEAYKSRLFANEVMLLPYYIAALNIEHAYYELTGTYEAFEGLCFVDTLELTEAQSYEHYGDLWISEKNAERVKRQRTAPVTVIVGNPPYNMGQLNENDNNKNRKYEIVDKRIAETYARDSDATLNNKLYDPYVKFFRWASDRLGDRSGVVCYVSNNSFVHQHAFDGMRKHLQNDFSTILHIDLHGNVRKNPDLSGTMHNVFGIQVGVGITLAIRKPKTRKGFLYERVPEDWTKNTKLDYLARTVDVLRAECSQYVLDKKNNWLTLDEQEEFDSFLAMGSREAKASRNANAECLFSLYSLGVTTNRDSHAYDFRPEALEKRAERFVEIYNRAVDSIIARKGKLKPSDVVDIDDADIKWTHRLKEALRKGTRSEFSPAHVRWSLYRPFTKKALYFDDFWNERRYRQHLMIPTELIESENQLIVVPVIACERDFFTMCTRYIPNLNFVGFGGAGQSFPYYAYSADGTNRRENITDWALKTFRDHYKDKKIDKWAIFHYVYGVLHHPGYREKYGNCLKRELPRIPFAPDFRAFSNAGKRLADLHLNYEDAPEYKLEWIIAKGKPLDYRVKKMRLNKDKTELKVNDTLILAGIPPETYNYRLGNRSALEWIIDQYQVKTDKRSGITSDPNQPDDPEYIVKLVGKVITVSLETVNVVASLPEQFAPQNLSQTQPT